MPQPSLRITRVEQRRGPARYVIDVWNPLTAAYEVQPDFAAGMDHVQKIAGSVHDMWVAKEPALATLPAPPAPVADAEFAEFRITAQAQRHYDIRSFDQPDWAHFRGYISQAAEQICAEVGYVLAPSQVPAPPPPRLQAKSA